MQTNLLQKQNTCGIIDGSTAPAPHPPAYDNMFVLYLQERRRALLTELRSIESLQAQIREGKPCFIGS